MITRLFTKRMGKVAMIALLGVCVSGCGQKGPLRSPDENNEKVSLNETSVSTNAAALEYARLKG